MIKKGSPGIYILISILILAGVIGIALFISNKNSGPESGSPDKPNVIMQFDSNNQSNPGTVSSEKPDVLEQKMILSAIKLYNEKKAKGLNFENGPCLSDNLAPDWVADTAHYPRTPGDDLPENQCTSFREGRSHHFVELDTAGGLIQVH